MKQRAAKRKMLECVIVGEKVVFIIQMKNQMEKVVRKRILNGRKGDAENVNEKKKVNISEEEEIGKRKYRRKSRTDKLNEVVRGWISSFKK